jgi:RNA polymerase sigma-70 factor (ECF subfamily)
MVLAAQTPANAESSAALAGLCETYWYPLYAYVRHRGFDANDAQDLTQDFFAHLLESEAVQVADPNRGKFRSFLLTSLNHFLTNQWRKGQAQKRGGGKTPLSLDLQDGEKRYCREPAHDLSPERIYERRWAMTLLDRVLAALREEYVGNNRADLFDQLKDHLGGSPDALPYRELAARLNMSEGSLKVAVHRLRRRCGDLLRQQIAQTLEGPADVDDELARLFTALKG